MNQKQQGDIILKKVNTLPKGCIKRKRDPRGIILGEGESHGHTHKFQYQDGVDIMDAPDGKHFLVNNTSDLIDFMHEEHKPFPVEPGIWEFDNVREFDYLQEMERKVID